MAWFLLSLLWICMIPADYCHHFIPEIPEHCRNMKYCEDVPNYPQDYVNRIIQNLDRERYGLTDDKLLIEDKTSPALKEYSLCKTITKKMVNPRAVPDKNDDVWKFVINIDLEQTIEVEICAPEAADQPCGNGVDINFFTGYLSRCQQKYIYRYMLGINETGNVTNVVASMPSCCACVCSRDLGETDF